MKPASHEDLYSGGWKVIGTIRDATITPQAPDAEGEKYPADIFFTDLGVLVVVKGDDLSRKQFLELQTTISYELTSLTPEQVKQAHDSYVKWLGWSMPILGGSVNVSILYDEVKDVRLTGGKQPSGWATKLKLAGDKPQTRVWLTKSSRILIISPVALSFSANLSAEEVRAFLQRTPLALKVK